MKRKNYLQILKEHASNERTESLRSNNFLSELFVKLNNVKSLIPGQDRDKHILRLAIVAELDAISLYEAMASLVSNSDLSKVLMDVAREEKVHASEFELLLKKIDSKLDDVEKEAEEEVKELIS